MADVFNAEVVTLAVGEGAAYGAALQALWCWGRSQGDSASIESITDRFVRVNRSQTGAPDPRRVEIYERLQGLQDQSSLALRETLAAHRRFVMA